MCQLLDFRARFRRRYFCKRFVTEAATWLHLDMYAWNSKDGPGDLSAPSPMRPRALRVPEVIVITLPLRADILN